MNYDEIAITKHETEFVAKHKDYDVIGVGGNEFEAVLELSKALGALMFSKDVKAKKVTELLGLYISVHGVVQSWDTMPDVEAKIQKLQKELREMK